jgi:hypothetical protein
LSKEYGINFETGDRPKYLFWLPYLSPNGANTGFTELMSITTKTNTEFTDYTWYIYFKRFYFSSYLENMFLWAIKPANDQSKSKGNPSTSNETKSFHAHYNN